MPEYPYVPGLAGVPAAESAVSYIDGEKGILEYRGIPIQELVAHSSFEETAYLLMKGHLPTMDELNRFKTQIGEACALGRSTRRVIEALSPTAHPMAALQTAVASVGLELMDCRDEDWRYCEAVQIFSKFPTIVAATHRVRHGLNIIDPDPGLSRAADFLKMLTGREPDNVSAHVMDACLVVHAEHTMNASTFTARVCGSTEASPAALVAAAVGTLSGPLHGGANEHVLEMLQEIGTRSRAKEWFDQAMAERRRIMGFGHRVYKTKDPRALSLQKLAAELFTQKGHSEYYDIALELEVLAKEKLGHRGICPNVDFYSGIIYNKMGIRTDLFTPIFAISRVAGWLAHWLEQMPKNKLYRPDLIYTGLHEQPYRPITSR